MASKTIRIADPCDACPLDGDCIKSKGYASSRFLVVTKAPAKMLLYRGKHLNDRAMSFFARHMQREGFKKADFTIHASVRCPFEVTETPRKVRTRIFNTCKEWQHRVIERMRPDVIIPLGSDACRQVFGREVAVTKERGIPRRMRFDLGNDSAHACIVLPMLDPQYCLDYAQHESSFAADCRMLSLLREHEFNLHAIQEDRLGTYTEVDDLDFLIEEAPRLLSFDVETLGLDPFADRARIMTMQFCTQKGEASVLCWDHPGNPKSGRQKAKLRKQLRELFALPDLRVVGHNVKFDALWMLLHENVHAPIAHDTIMMTAVVDENMQNKNLAACIKRWVPSLAGYSDIFDREVDKDRMDEVPLARVVEYGGGDADASYRLFRVLYKLIRSDRRQYNSYRRVSIPGINAFRDVEARGVDVSRNALRELERLLIDHVQREEARLLRLVHSDVKKAHVEKGLKFSRPEFLRDVLFWHPRGLRLRPIVFTKTTAKLSPELQVPSVSSKDHLPFFFDDYPFVRDLAELIKTRRMLGTNVQKFQAKYVREGKVHCTFSLATAVTGRSSSSNPNLQNIPERGQFAKAYKRVFIAPPGYAIVAADFSQAELRIAANMAKERTMMRVYNQGGDIHATTAASVMGISEREFAALEGETRDLQRFRAKAVNFGFLYGMWWRRFKHYAKTQYDIDLTDRESETIRVKYFQTYPGLERWHNETKAFARQHGYVRSYCGRIRHLPMIHSKEDYIRQEAERQAVNSPVQAFASQLGVRAMAEINSEIDEKHLALVSFVHDCLYAVVPLAYVEWAGKTMKRYMEGLDLQGLFGVDFQVPMVADVSFGPNKGDTTEMKGLMIDEPFDFSKHELSIDLPRQRIPGRRRRVVVA